MLGVKGNNFPDLVLDVPPGDCNKEAIVVAVLLAGIVLRDLRRLVNNGADGVFHLIGCCNIDINDFEYNKQIVFKLVFLITFCGYTIFTISISKVHR